MIAASLAAVDPLASLPGPVAAYLEPTIAGIRAQVRADAESAAAQGARDAVLPWIIGAMALSVTAIGVAMWRR